MFKNMMMFAEEPTPPVNPVEPVTPEPAEPAAPVEPGTVPATEPVTSPVEPVTPPVDPIDPQKAKIDALQTSLDTALEELGKEGDVTPEPTVPDPVEPEPVIPVDKPVIPEPIVTPPVDKSKPVEPLKGDQAWTAEMKAIKERQDAFESSTGKELEQMKLKDEMIGLTSEVQAAITQYPNAEADRILLEIESGSDKTPAVIAKELHDVHQTLVDKISKEQEEKIKATLDKENEGKIKVPQSSGTSSTPAGTPEIGGPIHTKASQDAAWASATREAKANLQ